MQPSHTAGEARRRREDDRLAREAAAWTQADRAALMQLQQDVDTWQKTPDSPEQLAALPCLTLADVSDHPEPLPLEPVTLAGLPVLLHRISTGGIVYLNLYFDADGLDGEQLSRLGYLCRLLGNMPTARHTAGELNDLTRLLCGDLRFYASVCPDTRRQEHCRVQFRVSMSAFETKLPQALDLLIEILTQTRLEETAARDILRQRRTSLTENCIMAGHQAAASRLMAQFSAAGVAQEHLNGFAGLQWAKQQEEHWDWAALQPALEALLAQIAVGCRLTLGVTAPDDLAKQAAERLANCLPQGTPAPEDTALAPWGTRREGIAIPADISFACCGGNLLADGRPYTGAWQLVSKLVSLEYLWNVIRVQGGAYGTGLLLLDIGLAACYSYRDPRGSRSLDSYARCAEFLREFCRQGKDLTGLIIGAVSDSEPLLSPRARAMTADNCTGRASAMRTSAAGGGNCWPPRRKPSPPWPTRWSRRWAAGSVWWAASPSWTPATWTTSRASDRPEKPKKCRGGSAWKQADPPRFFGGRKSGTSPCPGQKEKAKGDDKVITGPGPAPAWAWSGWRPCGW